MIDYIIYNNRLINNMYWIIRQEEKIKKILKKLKNKQDIKNNLVYDYSYYFIIVGNITVNIEKCFIHGVYCFLEDNDKLSSCFYNFIIDPVESEKIINGKLNYILVEKIKIKDKENIIMTRTIRYKYKELKDINYFI